MSKVIRIIGWAALGHVDTTEGRGGMHQIGVFKHQADATMAAKGAGVMGGDGDTKHIDQIHTVYDSYADFTDSKNQAHIEAILSKLSSAETELLKRHFLQ